MDKTELERRFDYHKPIGEVQIAHQALRVETKAFAETIDALLQGANSREISLFWTNYEQAMFWLHAHLARNGIDTD